jgi:hypothetical protein
MFKLPRLLVLRDGVDLQSRRALQKLAHLYAFAAPAMCFPYTALAIIVYTLIDTENPR